MAAVVFFVNAELLALVVVVRAFYVAGEGSDNDWW